MADYSKDAAEALAAIKEAGEEYIIFRSRPAFDDISGTPVEPPDTPLTGKLAAVVLPRYKGATFASLDDSLKEALIRGKLKTVLAAAQGAPFAPEALDEITLADGVWQVVGCTALAPNGLPIIFTIGIHKK